MKRVIFVFFCGGGGGKGGLIVKTLRANVTKIIFTHELIKIIIKSKITIKNNNKLKIIIIN